MFTGFVRKFMFAVAFMTMDVTAKKDKNGVATAGGKKKNKKSKGGFDWASLLQTASNIMQGDFNPMEIMAQFQKLTGQNAMEIMMKLQANPTVQKLMTDDKIKNAVEEISENPMAVMGMMNDPYFAELVPEVFEVLKEFVPGLPKDFDFEEMSEKFGGALETLSNLVKNFSKPSGKKGKKSKKAIEQEENSDEEVVEEDERDDL